MKKTEKERNWTPWIFVMIYSFTVFIAYIISVKMFYAVRGHILQGPGLILAVFAVAVASFPIALFIWIKCKKEMEEGDSSMDKYLDKVCAIEDDSQID